MAQVPPLSSNTGLPRAPGSDPLTLGKVQFFSEEVPEKLAIGQVEQKVVVIEMVGGSRIVQPLGIQPKPVKFSGRFWGSTTQDRVQQIRSYAVAAQEVLLTWRQESWYCIVREFNPEWSNRWICDYDILLEITRDGNGALTNTSFPTVDSQVDGLNDQGQAVLDQIANQENAIGFGSVSEAWQLYLVALGILYASEQTF